MDSSCRNSSRYFFTGNPAFLNRSFPSRTFFSPLQNLLDRLTSSRVNNCTANMPVIPIFYLDLKAELWPSSDKISILSGHAVSTKALYVEFFPFLSLRI
jgi:hypothetical protein